MCCLGKDGGLLGERRWVVRGKTVGCLGKDGGLFGERRWVVWGKTVGC